MTPDNPGLLDREPLIEVRNLQKYFTLRPNWLARALARAKVETVHAVDGVDLKIFPQETVGLVGESGSGKTTLGRVLTRLYQQTSGEIFFQGKPLAEDRVLVEQDRYGDPQAPVEVKILPAGSNHFSESLLFSKPAKNDP